MQASDLAFSVVHDKLPAVLAPPLFSPPPSPAQVEYGVISQAGYAFSVIHSSLSAVVLNFKRLR